MEYSRQQLIRLLLKDLVTDIRFSERKIKAGMNTKEEVHYREICRGQVKSLYKNRHTVKLDRFGWPDLPEFKMV